MGRREASEDGSGRAEKDLDKTTRNTSPKLMSWLRSTKKASCWRSSSPLGEQKSVTTNDAGTETPAEQPARGAKQQPAAETSRAGRDLRAASVSLSIG